METSTERLKTHKHHRNVEIYCAVLILVFLTYPLLWLLIGKALLRSEIHDFSRDAWLVIPSQSASFTPSVKENLRQGLCEFWEGGHDARCGRWLPLRSLDFNKIQPPVNELFLVTKADFSRLVKRSAKQENANDSAIIKSGLATRYAKTTLSFGESYGRIEAFLDGVSLGITS